MQPHLKLTDTDEDLLIPPPTLLKHLESSLANFDHILEDLHCTPDDLHQTLADPQTNELLKLKTQLAALQLKLLAIRYIPHAFGKLVSLSNTTEKPEVARRAATTILNLAGIATHTAPDTPTAPTPQAQAEQDGNPMQETVRTPEDTEVLHALALVCRIQRKGVPLDRLTDEHLPAIVDFLSTTLGIQNPDHAPHIRLPDTQENEPTP